MTVVETVRGDNTRWNFISRTCAIVAVRYELQRYEGGEQRFHAELLTHDESFAAQSGHALRVKIDVTSRRHSFPEPLIEVRIQEKFKWNGQRNEELYDFLESWAKTDNKRKASMRWLSEEPFVGVINFGGDFEAQSRPKDGHKLNASNPLFAFYTGIILAELAGRLRALPAPPEKDQSDEAYDARHYREKYDSLVNRFTAFTSESLRELSTIM